MEIRQVGKYKHSQGPFPGADTTQPLEKRQGNIWRKAFHYINILCIIEQ